MSLTDKVAVVTGGGRGIGRGIVEQLLAQGARVLIAQRQPLDEALGQNAKVTGLTVDLSRREAPYEIASAVEQQLGGCDILVNNAA
ncbi:MAG: SDR family NAD(P)-dependent oxidoreductase [Thiolinea sp.]